MCALLHFAMLPGLSTYIVSVDLTNIQGNRYQFLWPASIPAGARNEIKKLNRDCFIPCIWCISEAEEDIYFGLKKIAKCFEEYKNNDAVNLLFHVFTKPSYVTNLGTQYMSIYRSMECAYRVIKGESDEYGSYGQPEMVKFFINSLHKEIEEDIKKNESLKKQLDHPKFIEGICNIRHNYVHTKPSTFQEDSLDKQEKMHIMSKCLIYQILKKIFEFPDSEMIDKTIIDKLNRRFRCSYPI